MGIIDLRRGGVQIGDYVHFKSSQEGPVVFISHTFQKVAQVGVCPKCKEMGYSENNTMFIHLVQIVGEKHPSGQIIPMLSVINSCNPEEVDNVSSVLQETVS